MTAAPGLPERAGPLPTTTPSNPHTHLDQQPVGEEQRHGERAVVEGLVRASHAFARGA